MAALQRIIDDVRSIRRRDPAAAGAIEVLLLYPGLHAILIHRIAHRLWQLRVPLLPALLASVARLLTGIEIHPGARIGRRVFIDHGAGVVIGETAIVGDDVTIYHEVTLGGTGKATGKRHPTIGNGVLVGAGAKVLGDIAVGDQARIGAGAVVLKDVPARATVAGVPARVGVRRSLSGDRLPTPVRRVHSWRSLEQRVAALEGRLAAPTAGVPGAATAVELGASERDSERGPMLAAEGTGRSRLAGA